MKSKRNKQKPKENNRSPAENLTREKPRKLSTNTKERTFLENAMATIKQEESI